MNRRADKRLLLRFGLAECRCGERRVYGQACKSCGRGPDPTEVDPELQLRRKLVAHARQEAGLIQTDTSGAASIDDLMAILTTAGDALQHLIGRANAALSGPGTEGFAEFAQAIQTLLSLDDQVQQLTSLRPLRALRKPLSLTATGLSETANSLLDALDAGGIEDAQRHGNAVQPAIDSATIALEAATNTLDAWGLLEQATNPLDAIMQLAAVRAESRGLLDLAALGSSEIETRIPGAIVPLEFGLTGAVVAAQASALFDEDCFWGLARRVFAELQAREDTFSRLVADTAWRADWSRSIARAFWAAERFTLLIARASHDEEAVRTILSLCHDLQEGLTKTVLATLRFVADPNTSYEALLASGPTNLAEWAVAHGMPELGELQIPSRNAHAHSDWRIEDAVVVLCLLKPPKNGPARLTPDELTDHALAVEEVTMALFVAIVTAIAAAGLELPSDEELITSSSGPLATAVLAACGWRDTTISTDSPDAVRIDASAQSGSVQHFATLGYLFPSAKYLEIGAQIGSRSRSLRLDLSALRAWSDEQHEAVKLLAFMEFLHKSTVDSAPIADQREVRRVVAGITSKWITEKDDHRGVVSVFKKAREVASACHDDELLQALKTAQGWRSSVLNGVQRPVDQIAIYLSWADGPSTISLDL